MQQIEVIREHAAHNDTNIDLFSYFVAFYACFSADSVKLECVECCGSCSHPGSTYVPVSHRRVDFFN